MNILFANNYYYLRGGSERIMFEELAMLEEHGHKVVGFSRKHDDNIQSTYGEMFPKMNEYNNLNLLGKINAASSTIYNRNTGKIFSNILDLSKTDLVHAHNIYGGLTTSILDAARNKEIPAVMSVYDCKLVCPSYLMLNKGRICYECKGGKFYNCFINRCHKNSFMASLVYTVESYFNKLLKKYSTAKYLICESQSMIDRLLESGFEKERLVLVPNFVDIRDCQANYSEHKFILYVGRLSEEKGIMKLINSVIKSGIELRIVGNGPLREDIQNYISRKSIDNIIVEGYVSEERLHMLYRESAFLVIPSICNENSPVSVLEAFSFGKPVIGSKVGGIPEMIKHEFTGWLFDPVNEEELHDCIQMAWNNKNKLIRLGKNARNEVETHYSRKNHYKKLIAVYQKAINDK